MRTRTSAIAIGVIAVLGISACGDDSEPSSDPTTEPSTASTITTTEPADVTHPTGADELAIELDTTVAWHGSEGVHVMIGGDGRVYRKTTEVPENGFESAAPPPPPETTPYTVAELTPAGMDRVFERAAELGLTSSPAPEYDSSRRPTDQGSAQLTIVTDGSTIEHSIYDPQPPDEEDDEERARLSMFMSELTDIESLVDTDDISDPEPYVPERWIVTETWRPADPADWSFDAPPAEGCMDLDSAPDRDTATGDYADPDDPESHWKVAPAMPWDDC